MADRDIIAIIDSILDHLPLDSEVCILHLRPALKALRESAMYTPPECMVPRWVELTHLLVRHLGQPDTDWKRQVATIMTGRG